MPSLRLATDDDLPILLDMGAAMFSGSSFAPMTYSREKVEQSLRHGMRTALVVVSLDDAGEITGCIHGDVIEPWYSTDRMAVEMFVYVRPEHRGTRAAWMLIRSWVVWAIENGAKQIRPGTAAVSEAADRMYRKMGFQPAGALYVMNVNQ